MVRQQPHFEHHMRELYRTRRRFRMALAVLFVGLFAMVGLQYQASNATTGVLVKGRVTDSNGLGLANVRMGLCYGSNGLVTNASGYWWTTMPYKSGYCVRYLGGVPAGFGTPVPQNNRVSGQSGYEHQVAGFDCGAQLDLVCGTDERTWDRGVDTGIDFVSQAKPVLGVSTRRAVVLAESTSKTGPAVPGNFQATVESGNAIVHLSWDASSSATGLKGYVLERSIDQTKWDKLAEDIQATNYSDNTAGFGVTYYYRLSAVDAAGGVSGYATTEATTGDFNKNTGGNEEGTTYTSDDGLVTVTVPAGAVSNEVGCTVTAINPDKKPGTKDQPLVAGPYYLVCKSESGDVVKDFLKPVTWTYDLSGKLRGLNSPKPYSYDEGKTAALEGSTHLDPNTNVFKFDAATATGTMVMATKNQGLSLNLVAVVLALGGIIFGLAVLISRKKQKSTYDEYLRKKYYDL